MILRFYTKLRIVRKLDLADCESDLKHGLLMKLSDTK